MKRIVGIVLILLLIGCAANNDDALVEEEANQPEEELDVATIKEESKEREAQEQIKREKEEQAQEAEEDIEAEEEKSTEEIDAGETDESTKEEPAKKEPAKEEPTKPEVSEASGTYYVTAPTLNVRAGDGTDNRVLGHVSFNNAIDVTGKTSKGWYEFDYNGNKGYVSGIHLADAKQPETASNEQPKEPANKEPEPKADPDPEPEAEEEPDPEPSPEPEPEEEETEPSTPQNVVDQMNHLGNSEQVILVTTASKSANKGQVRTFEKDSDGKWHQVLQATAHIGKNGFSLNKVEGDGKSPIGKYSIGTAFGYQGNPGTKLSFRNSTANDVWVDDPNSRFYNTLQQDDNPEKDWESAESMMHRLYNYGFVINYNTAQTPGRGSAIFMHVGNSYTEGCTAMNQSSLIRIMNWVDPSKNPVVIQTPESGLGNY